MVQDDIGHPKEVWVRRKLFHAVQGTVFILCMMLDDRIKWFFLLVLAFGIMLSLVQERVKVPVITWFLERYDKKGDKIPGQGPVTFFTGSLFVWFLFGGDLAIACIIALTFGDPLAYVIGRSIPGPKLVWNKKKSVIGTLSFFIAALMITWSVWGTIPALIISLTAAIAESLPFPKGVLWDDNVMVPVISSLIGFASLVLLGVL